MRFYILCPYGARTGGPEALHQLADSLNRAGQEAYMFYLTMDECQQLLLTKGVSLGDSISHSESRACMPDYTKYNAPSASEMLIDDRVVIVFPEIFVNLIKIFERAQKIVWWLSVDNGFLALSQTNLNYLRFGKVIHATQSYYAKRFVESVLGVEPIILTDYVSTETKFAFDGIGNKKAISLNARPNKIIFDVSELGAILNEMTGLEIYFLNGMQRREVDIVLASSFFYIDLANFPGLDRTPREALILGAIPMILDAGAAKDFGFPQDWLIPNPDINSVVRSIAAVLAQYGTQILIAKELASRLAGEKDKFDREVLALCEVISNKFATL